MPVVLVPLIPIAVAALGCVAAYCLTPKKPLYLPNFRDPFTIIVEGMDKLEQSWPDFMEELIKLETEAQVLVNDPPDLSELFAPFLKTEGNDDQYRVNRPLPRTEDGLPIADSPYPHTQIGEHQGRRGSYRQTREWGKDGELKKDTDWTDHGRKGHTNPHDHNYEENSTGGTKKRGGATPTPR